ncbi:MAG TPA: ion transporter, partial [Gemmatimonadetes bacterium]|nr:ion transporter [Gemmatimonadota bacterium]
MSSSSGPTDLRPPDGASKLRHLTFTVIFGHDTRAGRHFDVLLIVAILASVFVIMMESVASVRAEYGGLLRGAEWFFTVLFTVEYATRLWCVRR